MKFIKPTLITITAPTCSGKSVLLEALTNMGYNRIVSTTTRKARAGEVEGVDYNFISNFESETLEKDGKFAELVEFRGTRYGVTHDEMKGKMTGEFAPVVILEPKGLKVYEKYCQDQGWDIFKIFVSTNESIRINRLNTRTANDIEHLTSQLIPSKFAEDVNKLVITHTSRILSITNEERVWQASNTWDAIVPGDSLEKAIKFITQGIECRNKKIEELQQNQ